VKDAALELVTAKVADKVEELTNKLVDVVAREFSGGGAARQAQVAAVGASIQGRNPAWAAVKGAWAGGGNAVKAAMVAGVVAMVLLLVLSPALLLAFLVSLLVVAAVRKARSASASR
jgi:hypothetical protein